MKSFIISVLVFIVAATGIGLVVHGAKKNQNVLSLAPSYTVQMTTTFPDDTPLESTLSIESDKRSYAVFTSDGEKIEYIAYDGQHYMKGDETDWLLLSSEQALDSSSDAQLKQEEIDEMNNNSKQTGQEACGLSTCNVYKTTYQGTEATMWIEAESGLLQKMSAIDEEGRTVTMVYSYDKPVVVVPPQVKEENKVESGVQ